MLLRDTASAASPPLSLSSSSSSTAIAQSTRLPPNSNGSGDRNTSSNSNRRRRSGNTRIEYAGMASIGSPPKVLLPNIELIRYRIHDFVNRREQRGEFLETGAVIAHGYPWKLRVFPNGRYISVFIRYAGDDDEFVNNYNCREQQIAAAGSTSSSSSSSVPAVQRRQDSEGITARANFICKSHKKRGEIRVYTHKNDWGFEQFLERNRILMNSPNADSNNNSSTNTTSNTIGNDQEDQRYFLDDNGALTIDVELQVCERGPWINPNFSWNSANNRYGGGNVWYPKESNTVALSLPKTYNDDERNHNDDSFISNGNIIIADDENRNDKETKDDNDNDPTNHFASLYVPPSSSSSLSSLSSVNNFADLTFLVDGIEFKAHKAVLAIKCRTLLDFVLNDDDDDDTDSSDDDDDDQETDIDDEQAERYLSTSSSSQRRRGRRRLRRTKQKRPKDYTELHDVNPKAFERLLEYVYGIRRKRLNNNEVDIDVDDDVDENDEHENEAYAKELLLVGNRFGCDQLKLYAESVLVEHHMNLDNAAELLLLADGHSCALLKEAAMDIVSNEPQKAMTTSGWHLIEESSRLLTELLLFYNRQHNHQKQPSPLLFVRHDDDDDDDDDSGLHRLDVTSLRCRLEELNLPCDGSREMLINRLRKA